VGVQPRGSGGRRRGGRNVGRGAPDEDDGEDPYEAIDRSIDPEEIDLENAAFVALGALVGVLIILRTAMVFTG